MRNILNVIKRRIRNLPDKWKEGIVYPVIGTVVGGLILALIVNLCGNLFQTVRDKKSQFDVSGEMLTPIPAHTHDNKIAENEDANTINLESTDTESMAVNSSFDMYVAGTVNGKRIPMYVAGTDDLEHVPTVRLSMTAVLPETVRTGMTQGIPAGRAGQPEDVAQAVAFFAAEQSSYLTGQVLCVDGGMAM